MINTILTPDEATQARHAVGLSQNNVAKATALSRTTLALFEVKKYFLDDDQLLALRDFYEAQGYTFSEPAEEPITESRQTNRSESSGVSLLDGFAVPEGIDEDTVEQILTEYQVNENQIERLLKKRAGIHWFSGDPKEEGVNQLQQLMSQNYLLAERLKGHEILSSITPTSEIDPETVTNSVLLNNLLNTNSHG